MNDLFIQGMTIDWNRVRPYNYVRQIPPSAESTLLHSISPLRSLWAKMEAENLHFWKQSLLLTASTQRVERRTIHFPHTTPIRNYVRL